MAKGANVDKLAAEFADELDNLGVRVAALEKKADNVKITGQIRAHYEDSDNDGFYGESSILRTRIWVTGQVNENWSYTGMVQNQQNLMDDSGDEETTFQRAFVNGRVGGVKVEAGRNNATLLDGEILSNRVNRVKLAYGKDVKLSVEGGKLASAASSSVSSIGEEYYAVTLAGKLGKLGLEADYIDYKDDSVLEDDNNIWAVAANYRFDKDWAIRAAYLKGDYDGKNSDGDDGYYAGINFKGAKASKAGSWGLYATYYDLAASSYLSNGWESTIGNKMREVGGYEGWKVGGNLALAKNIVAAVEYHKLDAKINSTKDTETLWSEVIFTF
jgi:hypothetical protein